MELPEVKPFGLVNFKVNCYFNSLLQALMSCKYLIYIALKFKSKSEEFNTFIRNILTCPNSSVAVEFINYVFKYISKKYPSTSEMHGQLFSLEFFPRVLDAIEQQPIISDILQETHPLSSLFKFDISQSVICDSCNNTNTTSTINLEYTNMEPFIKSKNEIEFIYNLVFNTSTITDYYCEKCKKTTNATIKQVMTKSGRYMLFAINRLIVSSKMFIPNSFTIPIKSGIKSGIKSDKKVYKLVSTVDYHGGIGLTRHGTVIDFNSIGRCGHYTATGVRNGKAYLFNDSCVSEIPSVDVKPNSTICIYETE